MAPACSHTIIASVSIFQTATASRSRRMFSREFCQQHPALRDQRAQGMPGARRARSLVCEIKKHTSIVTTVTPVHPAFPTQWFYGLYRALPGDRAFLPPSPAESYPSANLTPASGRQDHTTSPSAVAPLVLRRHRIPHPTSVTIAQRPSRGGGTESIYFCFYPGVKQNFGKSEITSAA